MEGGLRQQLIDIAMEPSRGRERDRLAIADATSTVRALEQELADSELRVSRLKRRVALARAHSRQLNDEYALKHGSYPL